MVFEFIWVIIAHLVKTNSPKPYFCWTQKQHLFGKPIIALQHIDSD